VIWSSTRHLATCEKGYLVYDDCGKICKSPKRKAAAISAFQRQLEQIFAPGNEGMNARLAMVMSNKK